MKRLVFIVFCIILMFSANAQNADSTRFTPSRPKVGVVLSGGGAKGFAHIGALRVIEEAGIPIDYIAGTSMGSIIGGLYAVGYDPDMMQKLCTEQNWDLIIKDQIPRKFMPLEKRINERHYLVTVPYKNGKFKLKRSMIDGMYVNMLLTRLVMPAYEERDFSKLPVPFLCIATDMITADPVEFTSGSLAQSIRSSMSIPFLFEPIDYDGHLLCDGGLTNNFPVRNVRDKGVDIIIGVDLEIIQSDPDVLDNSLKVLERLISVVSQDESNKARKECNILIRPDIGKANMMSFNDFSPIIKCGEEGAREKFPELKHLADSLQEIYHFEVERHHTQPVDRVTIASVDVEGLDDYNTKLLKSEFGDEFPHEFLIDEIETIIVKIYSQGYYSNVWYELVDSPDGNILKLHCKQRTSLTFSVGAHYDNNYGIGVLLNFNARTKRYDFNVDLNLSDNPYAKANITHRYSKMVRGCFEISAINLKADLFTYHGTILGAMKVQQNTGNLFLQIVPSVTQTFKLGFRMDYTMVKDKSYSDIITPDFYKHELYPKFYAQYFFNNEDQTDFPRKGWNINAIGKCIMYDGVFSSSKEQPAFCVQADIRKSFPIGQRHAFRLGAVGAARLGDVELSGENMFFVGGQSKMYYVDNILSFTGLPFVTVYTEYAAYARAAWQWNFYKNFYGVVNCDAGYFKNVFDILYTDWDAMDPEEAIEQYVNTLLDLTSNSLDTWFVPDNFIMGVGVTLGVKTMLGPIELQLSKSNVMKDWTLFVNFGYWF